MERQNVSHTKSLTRTVVWMVLMTVWVALAACSTAAPPPHPVGGDGTAKACTTATIDASAAGKICGIKTSVRSDDEDRAPIFANAYKGIPYAMDTSGNNRWEDPRPQPKFATVYHATDFGKKCPQMNTKKGENKNESEDCLSLNIWAPVNATRASKLPVMFWIHGGAFDFGASSEVYYDGAYTSGLHNVIIVSINYRLGVFGFLATKHGSAKHGYAELKGNYGLKDQQLAMKWVHDNIEDFGGDPANVTLYGESAGAMSVALHLASIESSQNYFSRAIMESNVLGVPYKNEEASTDLEKHLGESLGCGLYRDGEKYFACLRKILMEELIEASKNWVEGEFASLFLGKPGMARVMLWSPTIDGDFVQGQPLQNLHAGRGPSVAEIKPYISGTNHDEGFLFTGSQYFSRKGYKKLISSLFPKGNAMIFANPDYRPKGWVNNNLIAGKAITDFAFVCGNKWGMEGGDMPRYGYSFNKVSNFNLVCPNGKDSKKCNKACNDAVCHAFELPYVFHTFDQLNEQKPEPWVDPTSEEFALSATMNRYWVRFAKTGDPNGDGDPVWPLYTKASPKRLVLDTPIFETEEFADRNCDLWNSVAYKTSAWDFSSTFQEPPTDSNQPFQAKQNKD